MKRKVFNMFMVGALVLPSASMFVSCKDYDDDINNLQQQIDELSKTIKTIQDQIAAGSVITSVAPTGNGVTITLSNNKTFTITNGNDGAAGKDGTAWTIGTDGYWYKDGAKTDYCAKGDAGATGTPGIYYVPNAQGFFDIYNGDGTRKEQSTISWKATDPNAITAVKNDGENTLTLTNVQNAGDTKTVVIDLSSKLYALQLNPDFYYHGIQAIDCATFDYTAIKSFDKADKDGDLTFESDVTTATPDLVATYFLNPSSAKMDYTDLSKYSFVAFDKETRATDDEDLAIKVTKAAAGEKGSMIVKASYNSKAIKNMADNKAATFIALQYNGDGKGFVTSDLAVLRATKYTNPTLTTVKNDDFGVSANGVLTLKASDANALASVPVNSTNGVNLVDIMSTTMKPNGGDEVHFTSDMLKDYGFEYAFTLVEGNDYVSCENGVLKPVNKPAAIGKSAVVRVELKDNNKNKIAQVGYLKINIVDKKAETRATVATKLTSAVEYNVFGQKADAYINIKETTDWNVDDIVNIAGVSADNFAHNYDLVLGDGGVKQFKSNVKDAIGKITFVNNKFAWTILSKDVYNLLKDGKNTSLTTSVCYLKKAGMAGAYDSIYVNFEWTPTTINVDNTINLAEYYTDANWEGNTLTNTVVGNEGEVVIDMAQSLKPFKNDINIALSYSFAENQAEGFSVNGTTIQYAAKKDDPKVNIATIIDNKIQLLRTGQDLLNAKKVDLNVVAAAKLGDLDLKVNNAAFKVKFRPQINVTLNPVAFTDKMSETRNLSYETSIPSYEKWGLTTGGITLDTDNCKADVDIDPAVLKSLFTYETLNSVVPGKDKPFGKLTFNHVAGDFAKDVNVTIPVKFTYGWGVYETSITVKINKRPSAAKRY